jgi:hypothetical protein
MVRLSEIQASLAANRDPKTLAIISRSVLEIEAHLACLTDECRKRSNVGGSSLTE